jgi:hypothetical protein
MHDMHRTCALCASPLPVQTGRGRPRKFCKGCAAPAGAAGRAWREANPDAVARYNAARRVGPSELVCAYCGQTFTSRRRDTLTCGFRCRMRRKARMQREKSREATAIISRDIPRRTPA